MKIRFKCAPEWEDILPRPIPARRGLPDWFKQMPASAPCADVGSEIRTVKHCPPFIDALGTGFIIPLATDIRVEDERFEWDWDLAPSRTVPYPRSPLMLHLNEQLAGSPLCPVDRAAIKFTNFWTIETDPDYSLLVTHPLNREDLPFRTLSGLVDTDRFKHASIQFPALWIDADFRGVLARGTPIAQCVPVRRETIDMEFGTLVGDDATRFVEMVEAVNSESGVYRKRFRAAKP